MLRDELAVAIDHSVQLERALGASRSIGMAMGILMERHRVTADQAFALLGAASQRRNEKLRVVAERLVLTGALDDPAAR